MQQTNIVVDLGFGDGGKGACVDYLCRKSHIDFVVRYNGGSQAGHRVVTPDGQSHIFRQFGSGSLVGAKTYLSRYMLVNPTYFLDEASLLGTLVPDVFSTVFISENAKVVTPFHVAANRIREWARGTNKHGSCGMGIGETISDSLTYPESTLYMGELGSIKLVQQKLEMVQLKKREELYQLIRTESSIPEHINLEYGVLYNDSLPTTIATDYSDFRKMVFVVPDSFLADMLHKDKTFLFEGAQGVLLDENLGITPPHVTWTDSTCRNADVLLQETGYSGFVKRIGVTRAYSTRHGCGPFVAQHRDLDILPTDVCNTPNLWQDTFRRGYFDLVAMNYALEAVGGISELHVSHMDELALLPKMNMVNSYQLIDGNYYLPRVSDIARTILMPDAHVGGYYMANTEYAFLQKLYDQFHIPITVLGYGPSSVDRKINTRLRRKVAAVA